MVFQHLEGGFLFGLRYLHQSVFAFLNYNFDYMLRMDDDYFFCMNRFLYELPVPMSPMFHWGWIHCQPKAVRPDESMLLLSRDLLQRFLRQPARQLKCHPSAGQMIGQWAEELGLAAKIFRHEPRLHHHPRVSDVPALFRKQNLCQQYIGLHGCYAKDMRLLWTNNIKNINIEAKRNARAKRGHSKKKHGKRRIIVKKGNLKTNSKLCTDDSGFKWESFPSFWRFEPKPCIENPVWDTKRHRISGGAYVGREGN